MYGQSLHVNALRTIHHGHRRAARPAARGGQEVEHGLVVDLQVGYSHGDQRINGTCGCFEDLDKEKRVCQLS